MTDSEHLRGGGEMGSKYDEDVASAIHDVSLSLDDLHLKVGPAVGDLAGSLDRNFTSPNEMDRNMEPANVVDGLFAIARAVNNLADAVREPTDD